MGNILVIGDLHLPFEREGALEFCKKIYKEFKCTRVIQVGDLVDQYAFTRFVKNPDADGAKLETTRVKNKLKAWYKAFPNVDVTIGNHDSRLCKRAAEASIPEWALQTYHTMYNMPDSWKVYGHSIEVGDILFLHGDGLNADSKKSVMKMGQSVVYGHTHKASVSWYCNRKSRYFGLNVGCLVDDKAYAFEYSKNSVEKSMLGVGVIINNELPIFVPIPIKNKK